MTKDGHPPADREEWASLYGAFTLLHKESEREFSAWGLTVPQASILALLAEAQRPLPVTRLAQLLLRESPSITGLVDRMCKAGLVERVRDSSDRRTILVKLTDRGRQVHDEVRGLAAAMSDELFGVLSGSERDTLKDLLQKLRQRNAERLR